MLALVNGVAFPVSLSVDPFLCFLRFQGVQDLCIFLSSVRAVP